MVEEHRNRDVSFVTWFCFLRTSHNSNIGKKLHDLVFLDFVFLFEKMGKTRGVHETTPELRNRMVGMYEAGLGLREIAAAINCSVRNRILFSQENKVAIGKCC